MGHCYYANSYVRSATEKEAQTRWMCVFPRYIDHVTRDSPDPVLRLLPQVLLADRRGSDFGHSLSFSPCAALTPGARVRSTAWCPDHKVGPPDSADGASAEVVSTAPYASLGSLIWPSLCWFTPVGSLTGPYILVVLRLRTQDRVRDI